MALNVNDPDQIKRASQWAKLDEKNRHEALKALMGGPAGRAYMYDLLQACGVFRSAFSSDSLQMARNCGQVEIGLWVMVDIESVAPKAYQQMIQERNQRNADRNSVLDTIAGNSGGSPGEPGSERSVAQDDYDPADPWKDRPDLVQYSSDD